MGRVDFGSRQSTGLQYSLPKVHLAPLGRWVMRAQQTQCVIKTAKPINLTKVPGLGLGRGDKLLWINKLNKFMVKKTKSFNDPFSFLYI